MQDKSKYRSSGRSGLPKQPQQNNLFFGIILLAFAVIVAVFVFTNPNIFKGGILQRVEKNKFDLSKPLPTLTPSPKPTPSPTPRPLTFAEMNALYGPCTYLPTLFYHHIQTRDAAVSNRQTSLTVYTDIFQKQMQYLKDKGYNTATMNDLVNFFDSGIAVPRKSVLLTFDDGYEDFYTDAYPILSNLGFRATMFVPTGLIQNPDYLTWDQIVGMNGLVLFANHTWSHKNVRVSTSVMQTEISTADSQLSDRGLNIPKIFAYPYGFASTDAENYLSSLGYKAAFTTVPGSTLCKKQRMVLPRIRIGNISLSAYGF